MKYKIVTEASVDMPKKFAEENDITILPIEVNFNGELYPEGMPNDEFYAKLKSTGIIPKTSQPNQYKFENALTPYCNKDGWFVLTIVISSNLAGTIAQAKNAVDALNMKNVYICDSLMTTFAEGALIMEIVKFINEKDRKPQEVIDELERLKSKIKLVAVINDLKYLKQGGRVTPAAAAIGTVLNIKPILTIQGGKLDKFAMVTNIKSAKKKMINAIKKDIETRFANFVKNGEFALAIAHTTNDENAEIFKQELMKEFPNIPFTYVDPLSLSIATHTGPRVLAVGGYHFVK